VSALAQKAASASDSGREMNDMLYRPARQTACPEPGEWLLPINMFATSASCLRITYTAFCGESWPAYQRFCAATAGSARTGRELARAALSDLARHWCEVLRSASPSALAWSLLSARTASCRTESVRSLHRLLGSAEADALVLRYKAGLSTGQAAQVMGVTEADFRLLLSRAVMNVSGERSSVNMHPAHSGLTRGSALEC
jgi:hypothetical protein